MKKTAQLVPAPNPKPDQDMRKALQEGERRRQAYLATLHPRQREALDPRG